jgi:hypothetical protein
MYNSMGLHWRHWLYLLTDRIGNRVSSVGVFAAMVTFPSASTEIGPVVIGVTFVLFVVTASPFKVSFPIHFLPLLVWYLLMVLLVFLMYRLSQ